MHTRRILLAFSLPLRQHRLLFADYQNISRNLLIQIDWNSYQKTLSQGSYTHPDDLIFRRVQKFQ